MKIFGYNISLDWILVNKHEGIEFCAFIGWAVITLLALFFWIGSGIVIFSKPANIISFMLFSGGLLFWIGIPILVFWWFIGYLVIEKGTRLM